MNHNFFPDCTLLITVIQADLYSIRYTTTRSSFVTLPDGLFHTISLCLGELFSLVDREHWQFSRGHCVQYGRKLVKNRQFLVPFFVEVDLICDWRVKWREKEPSNLIGPAQHRLTFHRNLNFYSKKIIFKTENRRMIRVD